MLISDFLQDKELKIMSFTGDWGIGKTYLWNEIREKLGQIKLDKEYKYYSYTSIFGIDSIKDLKCAIQANCYPIVDKRSKNGNKKAQSHGLIGGLLNLFHNTKGLGDVSDYSKPVIEFIGGFVINSIKEYLICIDDFERKSKEIDYSDVFGVLSELKEERN